ncbi:MAG: response regulator [Chitinophagaceae bacterium]
MQPDKPQIFFLLVDDNDIDLFFHEKLLRIKKISDHITPFQSAADTLDYLEQFQEHPEKFPETVILLDIQMPQIDGFGFLDEFEKMPEEVISKTRIFLVSSSLDHGDLSRGHAHHLVDGILKKPLNADELIKALENRIPGF